MHKVRTRRQEAVVSALDDPIRVEDRMTAVCLLSFASRRCRSMPHNSLLWKSVLCSHCTSENLNVLLIAHTILCSRCCTLFDLLLIVGNCFVLWFDGSLMFWLLLQGTGHCKPRIALRQLGGHCIGTNPSAAKVPVKHTVAEFHLATRCACSFVFSLLQDGTITCF